MGNYEPVVMAHGSLLFLHAQACGNIVSAGIPVRAPDAKAGIKARVIIQSSIRFPLLPDLRGFSDGKSGADV